MVTQKSLSSIRCDHRSRNLYYRSHMILGFSHGVLSFLTLTLAVWTRIICRDLYLRDQTCSGSKNYKIKICTKEWTLSGLSIAAREGTYMPGVSNHKNHCAWHSFPALGFIPSWASVMKWLVSDAQWILMPERWRPNEWPFITNAQWGRQTAESQQRWEDNNRPSLSLPHSRN
jgi:hypothetical protein